MHSSVYKNEYNDKNLSPRELLLSILRKSNGNDWMVQSWGDSESKERQQDSTSLVQSARQEEESTSLLRWATFTSVTNISRPMAIHPHFDYISRSINNKHHWDDCTILPSLWNETQGRSNKQSVYVEIGANIGSCVMEMLLSTNASIIAFEPHPKNQFCLNNTISRLEPELQSRIVLVPIALGDRQESSTIYSAFNNMGNSVLGKIIKDYGTQKFEEKMQFTVPVERLDSILKNYELDVDIKLMKLDAQGYECKILDGMGSKIADSIQSIKLEYAKKWIHEQNCSDLFPRLRRFGFGVYKGQKLIATDYLDENLVELVAKRKQR